MSVLGAGFFGPTEGEKKRRLQGGKAHAWKPMCGDRVVTPDCDRSEITADERASFDRRRPLVEAQLTRRGEKASPALIDAVTTAVERGWFIFDGSTSHIELRRPNAQNTGGAELTIWRQAGNGQFVGSLLRRYVDVSRPRTYVELAQVIEVDDAF